MKNSKAEKMNKTEKTKKTKQKKNFKFTLFTLLITLSIVPLVLSVVSISATSLYITTKNLEQEVKDTLYIVASNLSSYCYEHEINAINAGEYYEYLDSLKEQEIEMAIIIEGAPCATSIKNTNDYRIREIDVEKDIVNNSDESINGFYDEYVEIDGKVYYAYYMPIYSEDGIIGVAFAGKLQSSITEATKSIFVVFVGIAILLVIMFAVVVLILSKGLLNSFEAVGNSVSELSKGNLRKQKEHKSNVKEMNNLLARTRLMQKSLAGTIGNVKKVSEKLVDNIAQVTTLSASSSGRAKQITSAMDELSQSTVGMNDNVQDINEQMLEIGNCVNDISENVEHLYTSSENILSTSNEAKENMNTIMESSVKSVDAVNEIATQIKQTNNSITEIDKAVELILSISDQTNLLSLNASIEAARAGTFGKGFAVVAEEIRSLSEQSAEGAEMIKNLAQTITDKSQKTVELADGIHTLMLTEQENVTKTQKKYEELSREIHQSVSEIRSIAEKTENLTNYKEKVIDNVQSLSSISEQNTANNEEVNANINEIVEEIQRVSSNCAKMNRMAKELQESVYYFRD